MLLPNTPLPLSCILCLAVNKPGYKYISGTDPSAAQCDADTYGPGLRKQRECVPCAPGFKSNAGSDAAGDCGEFAIAAGCLGEQSNPHAYDQASLPCIFGRCLVPHAPCSLFTTCIMHLDVLKPSSALTQPAAVAAVTFSLRLLLPVVPAGYFLKSPGQVAPCPKGEYKAGTAAAAACTPCAGGVTTAGEASTSEAACVVVLPSFYPYNIIDSIVKATKKCPQKYW